MKQKKSLILLVLLFILTGDILAQFGPIGYDFRDPYFEFNDLRIAVRLSTENNIYCPDRSSIRLRKTLINEKTLSCNVLSSAGGQLTTPGNIELIIRDLGNSRMSISAKGNHPTEICKTILILIKGIEPKSLVSEYPAAKGVKAFNNNNIMVSYPSRSATMPLAFITTDDKEWFLLSKDKEVRKKGFACSYDHINQEPVVIISHDEDTRKLSNSILSPEWIIGSGQERLEIVKERCIDLEQNFHLVPYKDKPHSAAIDKIKVVAFFQGMHWTGHMFNTFEQMGDQLEWVCDTIDGENVLAFLPAWDGRYYNTYPEHQPDERMGGPKGLKEFVEKAHTLGVKVVLMLGGPNLATFKFLKEHDMMDAALKGPDGYPKTQNWLDWNIDLSFETMGLIMNFGHPNYRNYMIEKTAELFDTYEVDGVFLDGTLRWENSPDYSPYEGLVQYTAELRKRYPTKMLMGEDGYDVVYGLFDMFHTSGGPMGLENFMLRYTRQFYYLSYPAENGSAGIHEIGWSLESPTINSADPAYTVPTISLFDGIIDDYDEILLEKLEEYKKWQLKECPILD